MIWIAIAIQLILSAGLLWATWQVWILKNALTATVETVDSWTEACENGLLVSSPSLEVARGGVSDLREQYQGLYIKLGRIQKLLSVLGRGVSFLGSSWRKSSRSLNNKSSHRSSGIRSSGSKHNVKRRR